MPLCCIAHAQVDGTAASINELNANAEALLHIDDNDALLRARAALTPTELATVSTCNTHYMCYTAPSTNVCTQ
jgi:hypothetical protein